MYYHPCSLRLARCSGMPFAPAPENGVKTIAESQHVGGVFLDAPFTGFCVDAELHGINRAGAPDEIVVMAKYSLRSKLPAFIIYLIPRDKPAVISSRRGKRDLPRSSCRPPYGAGKDATSPIGELDSERGWGDAAATVARP